VGSLMPKAMGRVVAEIPSASKVTSSDGRPVPDDIKRSAQRAAGAVLAGESLPEKDILAIKGFSSKANEPSLSTIEQRRSAAKSRARRFSARALLGGGQADQSQTTLGAG